MLLRLLFKLLLQLVHRHRLLLRLAILYHISILGQFHQLLVELLPTIPSPPNYKNRRREHENLLVFFGSYSCVFNIWYLFSIILLENQFDLIDRACAFAFLACIQNSSTSSSSSSSSSVFLSSFCLFSFTSSYLCVTDEFLSTHVFSPFFLCYFSTCVQIEFWVNAE